MCNLLLLFYQYLLLILIALEKKGRGFCGKLWKEVHCFCCRFSMVFKGENCVVSMLLLLLKADGSSYQYGYAFWYFLIFPRKFLFRQKKQTFSSIDKVYELEYNTCKYRRFSLQKVCRGKRCGFSRGTRKENLFSSHVVFWVVLEIKINSMVNTQKKE